MPRRELPVDIHVDSTDGRHLAGTGGRFQQGLHVALAEDAIKAWIPESGRTASGPPKFTGCIEHRAGRIVVTGVIREARIDQFNSLMWFLLAVLTLGSAVGGGIAEHQHARSAVLPVVVFAVFTFLLVVFGVTGKRGRAHTFDKKSRRLEASLTSWANPQPG